MPQISFSLIDFLRTGQIGSLRHSLTRQEVKDILGEPREWSISHKREKMTKSFIWWYGALAITFNVYSRVCRLSLVMFENPPRSLPPQISFESDIQLHGISKESFQKYLDTNDLSYEIDDSYAEVFGRQFFIEQCTCVIFDGEGESLTLIGTLMMLV